MKFIEPGVEVLRPRHSQPRMNASTTKVRRRLFADAPLTNNIKNDVECILKADDERFKAKYNFDLYANKPLKGPWDWICVDAKEVPAYYTRPYPAKRAESLKSHHMACIKSLDQYSRNNSYHRNGQFQSLATMVTPYVGEEQTTSTSTIHPVLPETPPNKGTLRSSSCGTNKRKITQEDAGSGFSEVKGDLFPNSSSSSLRSYSPSETLSSKSQDSVGYNLQNIPCTCTTTTTDNQSSSSQTTTQTSLAQQGKQFRQTNIKEYMKSQKNASGPVAKQARRA